MSVKPTRKGSWFQTKLTIMKRKTGTNTSEQRKKRFTIHCAEDLVALFALQEMVKTGILPPDVFARALESFDDSLDKSIFSLYP